MSKLDNNYIRFMDSLRKVDLLIIDDMALKTYSLEEARDLLEIAELRYNKTSTIFASQAPHEKWYEYIPEPTIADAFMDRIVHNAYIVPLDSKVSMREIMAQKRMKAAEILYQEG
jgi:DNA replication protein DnaC